MLILSHWFTQDNWTAGSRKQLQRASVGIQKDGDMESAEMLFLMVDTIDLIERELLLYDT